MKSFVHIAKNETQYYFRTFHLWWILREALGVKWEQIFQANNVHIWLKNENAKKVWMIMTNLMQY